LLKFIKAQVHCVTATAGWQKGEEAEKSDSYRKNENVKIRMDKKNKTWTAENCKKTVFSCE